MSKNIYVLDPGHCGVALGRYYLRNGKQSPQVPPGIYEGEFNRRIAAIIEERAKLDGVDVCITCPGFVSPRDKERITAVNKLHDATGRVIYVGIHANASPEPGWSQARGGTIFVSKSRVTGKLSSTSKRIAEVFLKELAITRLDMRRGIKGRRLNVLARTKGPAILCELGFMTNKIEAQYLASFTGRQDIASALYAAILRLEHQQ